MLMTTNKAAFDGCGDADAAEAAALYRLLTWLSPSFPVGAFSYSSGIEWAVEARRHRRCAVIAGLAGRMLTDGPGFCDGVLLAHAHRAASAGSDAALRGVAELAAAFVPSRERQLETSAQGRAFIDIARAAWNCDGLDQMVAGCDGAIVYPVAVGLVSAAHGIRLAPTMQAFLHAMTSNWISAAARLVPLGQTDSQRVLAASRTGGWPAPQAARSGRRSMISAARQFAPISPACGTRPSTRGCSGRDDEHGIVPAFAGRAARQWKEHLTCPIATARFASASVVPSDRERPR